MSGEGLTVRPGWPAAVAGVVVAAATSLWLIRTGETWLWLSPRLVLAGLALYVLSVGMGLQRGIGCAAVPVLTAAVFSEDVTGGIDWGRPLIIGCMWYVASELGWESIERSDIVASRAVGSQRQREVATVVIVTIAIGLLAAGAATFAPTRTLLLRAFAVVAVVAALGAALNRLNRQAEPTEAHSSA
jgi:hypothetical protein